MEYEAAFGRDTACICRLLSRFSGPHQLLIQISYLSGERHVHFKTVEDVSGDDVFAAIQKIGRHIGDPAKEGKAASLALQLLQAGSVKAGNVDAFFGILREAMAHRAAVRAGGGKELRDLFLATHEHNNVRTLTPTRIAIVLCIERW